MAQLKNTKEEVLKNQLSRISDMEHSSRIPVERLEQKYQIGIRVIHNLVSNSENPPLIVSDPGTTVSADIRYNTIMALYDDVMVSHLNFKYQYILNAVPFDQKYFDGFTPDQQKNFLAKTIDIAHLHKTNEKEEEVAADLLNNIGTEFFQHCPDLGPEEKLQSMNALLDLTQKLQNRIPCIIALQAQKDALMNLVDDPGVTNQAIHAIYFRIASQTVLNKEVNFSYYFDNAIHTALGHMRENDTFSQKIYSNLDAAGEAAPFQKAVLTLYPQEYKNI